jgi:hypothetical protein
MYKENSKNIITILFIGFFICFNACEKDRKANGISHPTQSFNLSGKVQKATPFKQGTKVTLKEFWPYISLSDTLYMTEVYTDSGNYSFDNIKLNTNLVTLNAKGKYLSEIFFNEYSDSTLSLDAIIKLTDQKTANINVLTHLTKQRIEKLMSANNMQFNAAKKQSESELLEFFDVAGEFDKGFEEFDVLKYEEHGAFLLAVAIMMQERRTRIFSFDHNASFVKLTNGFIHDFKKDGQIDSISIIRSILLNISKISYKSIPSYIGHIYEEIYTLNNYRIPDIDAYVIKFMDKYSHIVYDSIVYPEYGPTPPHYIIPFPNILFPKNNTFQCGENAIVALVPYDSVVEIKFTCYEGSFSVECSNDWKKNYESDSEFTIISQKYNKYISCKLELKDTAGKAEVEYFKNNETAPYYTKHIEWNDDF